MNYVMNDFSLRGQFSCTEAFYDSIRIYTIPVLKEIQKEEGSIIWKKDTFWQQEVCPGINLQNIRPKKNERSPELTRLKQQLQTLYNTEPYWNEEEENTILGIQYYFDEAISNDFPVMNCFIKAYSMDGRIVSFEHSEYQSEKLEFLIEYKDEEKLCSLENIYSLDWWKKEQGIIKWPRIKGLYRVEVRAREEDRHMPHFHVTYNEYSAVFAIKDGKLIEKGKPPIPENMVKNIFEWYKVHRKELEESWKQLHTGIEWAE